MGANYPDLQGLDIEDAGWNLELRLDQIATIFAMEGWPLGNGVATAESIEEMIGLLVKQLAESPSKPQLAWGGRITVRRNPTAVNCLELSLDFGYLDFTDALEERAKGA